MNLSLSLRMLLHLPTFYDHLENLFIGNSKNKFEFDSVTHKRIIRKNSNIVSAFKSIL